MGNRTKLFLSGALQVGLVSANTYFIANLLWLGITICGFLISFTWTQNVKRISIGDQADRIVYSLGATCGGLLGIFISKEILKLF